MLFLIHPFSSQYHALSGTYFLLQCTLTIQEDARFAVRDRPSADDDNRIEMISFETAGVPAYQGRTLCYYSTPEMRQLADVAAEARYRYYHLKEGTHEPVQTAFGNLTDAIWHYNGYDGGRSHWVEDQHGRREMYRIHEETRDAWPTQDVRALEYLRAADRLEHRLPGIRQAFRDRDPGFLTNQHLQMEGSYTVTEVDHVPSRAELKDGGHRELVRELSKARYAEEQAVLDAREAAWRQQQEELKNSGWLNRLIAACQKGGGLRR